MFKAVHTLHLQRQESLLGRFAHATGPRRETVALRCLLRYLDKADIKCAKSPRACLLVAIHTQYI